MKNILSKYLTLLITSIIPSVAMFISGKYIDLNDNINDKLTAFVSGLLLMSGVGILKENKKNVISILGFIITILVFKLKNLNNNNSIISSFYLDAVGDGLILGTLINTNKGNKLLLPIVMSLTLEMSATAISINKHLKNKEKNKISLASVVLFFSIILGYFISKYVNKELINGVGSASMIWIALSFVSLNKIKNKNLNYIFIGLITALFFN